MKRILLIQLRQLGDIILTTPCIREIKRDFPGSHITFLCHSMGKLILDGNPYLDEIVSYNGSRFSSWLTALQVNKKKFDLVIDFMNNPRSAMYSMVAASPERIAFNSRRKWAYTNVLPRAVNSDYIVREKFRLLQAAGFRPHDESLTLPWGASHTRPVKQMVERSGAFAEAPIRVVISPTHRRTPRSWSLERYAKVADHLVRDWGAHVTWVWGPGELETVRAAERMCRESTEIAPKTSFRELAAYIANTDLFLGNSNGPSHVAVACDTVSLQLHGPTQAQAWCPLSPRHQALAAEGVQPDIESISVGAVLDRLEAMRPTVEKEGELRQKAGIKIKWEQ